LSHSWDNSPLVLHQAWYCRLAGCFYSQRRKYVTSQQRPRSPRYMLPSSRVSERPGFYLFLHSFDTFSAVAGMKLAGSAPRIKVPLTCVVCRATLVITLFMIDYICL
jgi:hypothetical protein